MTSPEDRPRRRRRRPRRPAGEATGEGGSTRAAQDEPDGSASGQADRPRAEAATGRRGGSGRNRGQDAGHGRDGNQGGHGRDPERGWRELAGSSPSQVGLSGAMRARDVARPTAEDLAAAERSVVLVRRGWQPPEA